MDITSAF